MCASDTFRQLIMRFRAGDEIEELGLLRLSGLSRHACENRRGLMIAEALSRASAQTWVRVRRESGVPVVRSVWRQGERVA